MVDVLPGSVLAEQLYLTKNVTIQDPGASLQAPDDLQRDRLGTWSLMVVDGASVSVSGMTFQGPGPGNCASIHYGILVIDGGHLDISDSSFSEIRDDPFSGCQNGIGIRVGAAFAGETGTATITNSTFSGYQKGAIVVDGAGSYASIEGNTLTGAGNTPIIAQNGIQVSRGATADIVNNSITAHRYSGGVVATGVLLFQAGGGTRLSGNTIDDADVAAYVFSSHGVTIENNFISNSDWGIYNFGSDVTALGNTLTDNNEHIVLDDGAGTLSGNVMSGSVGVGLFGQSALGRLNGNLVSGTDTAVQVTDGAVTIRGDRYTGNGTGIDQSGGEMLVEESEFNGNDTGVSIGGGLADLGDLTGPATTSLGISTGCNFFIGNGAGLENSSGAPVMAQANWWNDPSGPSGEGPGSGDSVSTDVNFAHFLPGPSCRPIIQSFSLSSGSVFENDFVELSGTFTDADTDEPHTITIDWADGSPLQVFELPAGEFSFGPIGHQYLDDNPTNTLIDGYFITVTVSDAYNTASGQTTVYVSNVAPELDVDGTIRCLNQRFVGVLQGGIVDPGSEDTFMLRVSWGDGVVEFFNYAASTTSFRETHAYPGPGPYDIALYLRDDDGGEDTAAVHVAGETPQQAIENTIAEIERLIRAGRIRNGLGQSLIRKLDHAEQEFDANDPRGAAHHIGAFENELRALVRGGQVADEDAERLLDLLECAQVAQVAQPVVRLRSDLDIDGQINGADDAFKTNRGAYVVMNNDDDDRDRIIDTADGSVRGADGLGSQDEADLKRVDILLDPAGLDRGLVVLSRADGLIRVYSRPIKGREGAPNDYALLWSPSGPTFLADGEGNGRITWDLSVPRERAELQQLIRQGIWVEGLEPSTSPRDSGLTIAFLPRRGAAPTSRDEIKFTVIAFTRIRATIPATQSRRAGAPPVLGHVFENQQDGIISDLNEHVAPNANGDREANFVTPRALVLIKGSADQIPLVVSYNQSAAPIRWEVSRAADDPVQFFGEPTLTPDLGAAQRATLGTNHTGSFFVSAYVDVSGNQSFDVGEPRTFLPYILVEGQVLAHETQAHSENIEEAFSPGLFLFRSGEARPEVIDSPQDAGIHLKATLHLAGGGRNSERGLDRVFAAWIQNVVGAVPATANYASGATGRWIFATNRPENMRFVAGGDAPALVSVPILDSGRTDAGTGGDTATLFTSRTRPGPPRGQQFVVEAVDSPVLSFDRRHAASPTGSPLTRVTWNHQFRSYLGLWTNAAGTTGASGSAADRLYSVALEFDWSIAATWNIDIAGEGEATAVGNPAITVGAVTTHAPLAQAGTTNVEIRSPTANQTQAIDYVQR